MLFAIPNAEEVNVRFDGLLVTPTQLADRMHTMPTAIPALMGNIPPRDCANNTWQDREAEDVREALLRAAEVKLARAADPVYDDIEAEMTLTAGRGESETNDTQNVCRISLFFVRLNMMLLHPSKAGRACRLGTRRLDKNEGFSCTRALAGPVVGLHKCCRFYVKHLPKR